jgi:ABC-2 type transport system ATP-binding protein
MDSITVHDLERRFGDTRAVRGIDFAVREGEVFAFLGPNGAGKTTTISILCTLLSPTSGTAHVGGHDVVTDRPGVRRAIGVVFQDSTLDEQLTADQNLRFHAMAYGVPRDVARSRADELLDLMDLRDRRGDRVRTFSGGMKRRLEIARGLLHRPRVLFLDEPTAGLDPQTRRKIWAHVHDLRRREGVTIFFTTHYMDEAENSDRIAIIDHGRIVALDSPDHLRDSVGGDVVSLSTEDDDAAAAVLRDAWEVEPVRENGTITFKVSRGAEFLPRFVRGFPLRIDSIAVRRPTLDDVFVSLTGRRIRDENGGGDDLRRWKRSRRAGPNR